MCEAMACCIWSCWISCWISCSHTERVDFRGRDFLAAIAVAGKGAMLLCRWECGGECLKVAHEEGSSGKRVVGDLLLGGDLNFSLDCIRDGRQGRVVDSIIVDRLVEGPR